MSEPRADSEEEGDETQPAPDDTPAGPEETEPESDATVRVVDRRWWARPEVSDEDDGSGGSSKPTYVAELERKLGELDRQLEEKNALLKEYAAKYTAAAQEFDDTRVRLRREVAKDVDRETRRVLASFLEIIDNLDRAIAAAGDADGVSGLHEGVVMVRQQFLTTLDSHGVQPIDAVGEPFDPNLHDAVSMVPVTETDREGRVIDVVTPGYRVADDVLRPAAVTVGKLASPAPESR